MEGMSHRQIQHIAGQLHSYDWVILRVKWGSFSRSFETEATCND